MTANNVKQGPDLVDKLCGVSGHSLEHAKEKAEGLSTASIKIISMYDADWKMYYHTDRHGTIEAKYAYPVSDEKINEMKSGA